MQKTQKNEKSVHKRRKTSKCSKKYPSGGTLGVPWARFGRSGVALGRFLGALGRPWGALGRSWGAHRSLLDASWTQLGKKAIPTRFLDSNLDAKIHPSWLQIPSKIDIETKLDFEACFFRVLHIFH